jgi:hypothetical protein
MPRIPAVQRHGWVPVVSAVVLLITVASLLDFARDTTEEEVETLPGLWRDINMTSCEQPQCDDDPVAIFSRTTNGAPRNAALPRAGRRIGIIGYYKPGTKPDQKYFQELAHQSQLSRRLYAARLGYDIIWEDSAMAIQGKSAHWGKITAIAKWLPYYDWIWWLDIDTIIMNHTMPLDWIIDRYAPTDRVHLLISRDVAFQGYLNTGSMLIRSSRESMNFLRQVTVTVSSDEPNTFDQAPINELLFWQLDSPYLIERGFGVLVPPEHLNAGPPGWCCKTYEYQPGDFLVHFPNFKCERGFAETFAGSEFPLWARKGLRAALGVDAKTAVELAAQACCWFRPTMAPTPPSQALSRRPWRGAGDRASYYGLVDAPS